MSSIEGLVETKPTGKIHNGVTTSGHSILPRTIILGVVRFRMIQGKGTTTIGTASFSHLYLHDKGKQPVTTHTRMVNGVAHDERVHSFMVAKSVIGQHGLQQGRIAATVPKRDVPNGGNHFPSRRENE